MKKKMVALTLAAIMAATSLAGCGNSGSTSSDTTAAETAGTEEVQKTEVVGLGVDNLFELSDERVGGFLLCGDCALESRSGGFLLLDGILNRLDEVFARHGGHDVDTVVGMERDAAGGGTGTGGESTLGALAAQGDALGQYGELGHGSDHFLKAVDARIDTDIAYLCGLVHDGAARGAIVAHALLADTVGTDDDPRRLSGVQDAVLVDVADDNLGGRDDDACVVAYVLSAGKRLYHISLHALQFGLAPAYVLQFFLGTFQKSGDGFLPVFIVFCHDASFF